MPKRPNPFGDGSPLQMKTHVGTREMNIMGVDGDKNMKTVYEKTRQLLFSGARKPIEELVIDANDNSPCIPNQNMVGQMCIDKTGHIVPPCDPPVEPSAVPPVQQEDIMDIDSIPVENYSNKKISDFFAIKNRQSQSPQKPSL